MRGATAIEFALAMPVFLLFVFGLLECTRMLYLWNTAQEVTRRAARAATVTDFTDAAALARLRRQAIFRNDDGVLVLGGEIGQDHVRIDYLSLSAAGAMQPVATLPASPAANLAACTLDPHDPNCIRFVRVRLCTPDACARVPYQSMVPGLLPLPDMSLPLSTTVVRAESLGYRP
ncbi:MAG: TadE family protein [Pseudomonadota bacterium]